MFLRILITSVLALLIGCSGTDKASKYYMPCSEPVLITTKNNIFNDTARFLAGLPVKNEIIEPYIDENFYPEYSTTIDENWNKAFALNKESILKWRAENLKDDYNLSIFYPFSGPDIIHPLVFYPKAREIIMFGLEPTGGIPDITSVEAAEVNQQLSLFSDAIDFALNRAFFVTLSMEKMVKPSSLNGTTAIMFFFLARSGYDILGIREINIEADGSLAEGTSTERGSINGVEILFAEKDSREIKRVRYFTLNIENSSRQLARFDTFVREQLPFTTIVKSASYLMSLNNFSRIRSLILETSNSIIQDDSGIPYSFFRNNPQWNVTHFGRYHRPISAFKEQYQKALDDDNKRHSVTPIPFVYGYGYGFRNITYHLVLAERAEKLSP